jgi:hypothetical protein
MNASDSTRGASAAATFSPVYTRYVLGLLALVYIVNFVDRQVLSILLESI